MTLEWVRDNYDADKSRYIEESEKNTAQDDWLVDIITSTQFQEVTAAYTETTLLPAYSEEVTLEWVRDNYDANNNRYIDGSESDAAGSDWSAARITTNEYMKVLEAYREHTLLPEVGATDHLISVVIPDDSTLEVDGVEVI